MKPDERIEFIESSADRVRAELLQTLDELDRRRQRATDWRYQLSRNVGTLLVLGLGAAALAAAALGVLRVKRKTRRARNTRARVRAFARAWEHPRRVARVESPRSMPSELARKLPLIFATALSTQVARRGAQRLIPSGAQ